MSADFDFMKGNVETIILCSLFYCDKYGYEIARDIKERTDSKYEIKQPTLYAYLKRLESDGMILSYWGTESAGGRRRYYKLTDNGKKACESYMAEWKYHRNVMDTFVDSDASVPEVTQSEVTPIFGKKKRKRAERDIMEDLDSQASLSEQLDALTGGGNATPLPIEVAESQPQDEQPKVDRFAVVQDDAEDFIKDFDQRAKELTDVEEETEENYSRVLMDVVGGQLDDMQAYNQQSTTVVTSTEALTSIEDVADSMHKSNIKMRIYNRSTANYHSKTLMPLQKVLCQASWLTYAVAVLIFGVFALVFNSTAGWQPFVITLSIITALPIAFTVWMIADPIRKEKPFFNFKQTIIASSIVAFVAVLITFAINILAKIELSDVVAFSTQILIPTGIAVLLPMYVLFYNLLYKKY